MSKTTQTPDETDAPTDDRPDTGVDTDEDATVSILTYGDPVRSFAQLLAAVAEEHKVTFDEDGVHATTGDPASVAMVDATAHAEGFERFEVAEELTFGLNVATFRNAVQWARKRSGDGDPVAIDVFDDPARMRVRITRPDQQVTRITEWFGIDPDGMRKPPEMPDLDLPDRATPGVGPFAAGIDAVDSHDAVCVTRDGAEFVVESIQADKPVEGEVGKPKDSVKFANAAWSENDGEATSSLFSMDYLEDFAAAIKRSKADRLTVEWGDEFPTKLRIEHEEWGFETTLMLAPRIQAGEEDV